MKITDIYESTTSGSIATVATPMTTQRRSEVGKGVYSGAKPGRLLTGKPSNKKYANSLKEDMDSEMRDAIRATPRGTVRHYKKSNTWQATDSEGNIKVFNNEKAAKKHAGLTEGKMKQVAMDLEYLNDGNFQKKYKMSKEQMMSKLGIPANMKPKSKLEVNEAVIDYRTKKQLLNYADAFRMLEILEQAGVKVLEVQPGGVAAARFLVEISGRHHWLTMNKMGQISEAQLEEDDLIIVPGQGHRFKPGFHQVDKDKAEHEGETLKNSLRTIMRNAKELHNRLENSDHFPEWVSEKVGQIKGMMTSVTEYLISHQEQTLNSESAGVIAGGGVGEGYSDMSPEEKREHKRRLMKQTNPDYRSQEALQAAKQDAIKKRSEKLAKSQVWGR